MLQPVAADVSTITFERPPAAPGFVPYQAPIHSHGTP